MFSSRFLACDFLCLFFKPSLAILNLTIEHYHSGTMLTFCCVRRQQNTKIRQSICVCSHRASGAHHCVDPTNTYVNAKHDQIMYTQKKFEDQYTDFVQNALQRKHIIKKIIDRNQKKKNSISSPTSSKSSRSNEIEKQSTMHTNTGQRQFKDKTNNEARRHRTSMRFVARGSDIRESKWNSTF